MGEVTVTNAREIGGGGAADQATFVPGTSAGTIVQGVYETTPSTITNNKSAAIAIDTNRRTIVTQGTQIAGEDLTNNVLKTEERFTGINVTADTQIKSGAGFVHTLTFSCNDAAPTAGSIIVYDSLTETGAIVYSETFDTTAFRGYSVLLDRTFATGLYVGFTTTADVNCAVSYR